MDNRDVEIGRMYNEWKQQQILNNTGCGTPVLAVIVFTVVLLFSSCATKTKVEYVDREVVKYQKEFVHDTLVQHTHDSVYHTVFQKGDTVYNVKYVEKIRWKDKVVYRTDTCYQDATRTIIKESVKEKKIIPQWCYFSLVFSLLFFIFAVVKVIRWVQIR